MILYASATTTKQNLATLAELGFRLMFAPGSYGRPTRDFAYALDNGAWTAFVKDEPWGEQAFRDLVWGYGSRADFVVAPDIVMGGAASLARSLEWLPWLLNLPPAVRILVPVQNGMTTEAINERLPLGKRVGLFVGGDSTWKVETTAAWAQLAKARGAWCHVGRVNTRSRLDLCRAHGVDSTDGSGASRYSKFAHEMGRWMKQQVMQMEATP